MIPNELRPYFWDIDLESFKPQEHAEYTIERILELGNSQAFAWLQEEFSDDQIKAVVRGDRRLSAKSANFWALVYDIPENQVASLHPQK
jgi:hypothetical protein